MSAKRKWASGLGTFEVALAVTAVLLLACVGYRAFIEPQRITIADRPRTSAVSPDFLVRYLDATVTDYQFEQGFVTLPRGDITRMRLRGLLSALGTYIDLLHEDRTTVIARRNSARSDGPVMMERRSAEPTDDGRLAITSQVVEWNDQTWHEYDQLLASLESQYREVAEALRTMDAGFVVPNRFTPAEPITLSSRSASLSDRSTKPGTSSKIGEIIELSEVEAETTPLPPANQGRVLGN